MKSYGATDIGKKRRVNQDYFYCSDEPVGCFPNLYIVADGMGGHKAGDKASSLAVNRFVELARETALLTRQTTEFSDMLFTLLTLVYQQFPETEILTAICALLIKAGKKEEKYFSWYREAVERYNPEKLKYGWNTMPDGEEIFFIPNPALGLWVDRGRFEKE